MSDNRPLIDRLKGPTMSTILKVLAFVFLLLAFLIEVASASLGFSSHGWAYAGLASFVLSSLVP